MGRRVGPAAAGVVCLAAVVWRASSLSGPVNAGDPRGCQFERIHAGPILMQVALAFVAWLLLWSVAAGAGAGPIARRRMTLAAAALMVAFGLVFLWPGLDDLGTCES